MPRKTRPNDHEPVMTGSRALVALGSNQGDPAATVVAAMTRLRREFGSRSWRESGLWRTAPVNCPPGSPDFVNAVVAFEYGFETADATAALTLLEALLALEREWGRPDRRAQNAPRPLDLDLLLFGDLRLDLPECTLPHPRALDRRFVLEPAAEVAPSWIWPGTGRSVRALCEALREAPGSEVVERLV